MRSLITAMVFLAFGSVAMAQSGKTGSSTSSPNLSGIPEAPIGHRQPRADQVPSDKMDPNEILVLKALTPPPRE